MSIKRGRLRSALVIAVLLLTGTAAHAGFIFETQARSVSATGTTTSTAPNFDVFDATVSFSPPQFGQISMQHQRSELLPHLISVVGEANVSRSLSAGVPSAEARSTMNVTFNVTEPTPVKMSITGVIEGSGNGSTFIRLVGSTMQILWFDADDGLFPDVSGSRSATATLPAGSYQLQVPMYSLDASGTHSEISSFNFQLAEVPEPGVLGAGMTALLLLMRTRRATARAPLIPIGTKACAPAIGCLSS